KAKSNVSIQTFAPTVLDPDSFGQFPRLAKARRFSSWLDGRPSCRDVIKRLLEARKLSQADAAKVLGVTQPKVSALRHYKLAGFSVERLMNLLTALDQDVEIVIRRKPRSRKTGRISVVAA